MNVNTFGGGIVLGLGTVFGLFLLIGIVLQTFDLLSSSKNQIYRTLFISLAIIILSFVWASIPAGITEQFVSELSVSPDNDEDEYDEWKHGIPVAECNTRIEKAVPTYDYLWGKYLALFAVAFLMLRDKKSRDLVNEVVGAKPKS